MWGGEYVKKKKNHKKQFMWISSFNPHSEVGAVCISYFTRGNADVQGDQEISPTQLRCPSCPYGLWCQGSVLLTTVHPAPQNNRMSAV